MMNKRLLGFAKPMLGEPVVLTPSGPPSSRQDVFIWKSSSSSPSFNDNITIEILKKVFLDRRDLIALFRGTTRSTLTRSKTYLAWWVSNCTDVEIKRFFARQKWALRFEIVYMYHLQTKTSFIHDEKSCRWVEVTVTRRRRCSMEFSTLRPTRSVARPSARSVSRISALPLRVSSRSSGTPGTIGSLWNLTGFLRQGQVGRHRCHFIRE